MKPQSLAILTARGSRDLISVARQQLTQEWWGDSRQNVDLFVLNRGMCAPKYVHRKIWEVFEMGDEIMKELWAVKDKLSEEAGRDMNAFCKRLNRESLARGFRVVNRSHPPQMQVAEDPAEYKTK